jgi:hypothetical protein
MPDEEFDELGEDELVLLTRRFERLHENRVNMRRNTRTFFKCGKAGHYFAECPKVNNHDKHKFKDKRKKSKKKDHGHGKKTQSSIDNCNIILKYKVKGTESCLCQQG